jgi:hypothetical protein
VKNTQAKRGPRTKASKGQQKYKRHMVTMPPELYDRLQAERGLVPMATYICMLIKKGLDAE